MHENSRSSHRHWSIGNKLVALLVPGSEILKIFYWNQHERIILVRKLPVRSVRRMNWAVDVNFHEQERTGAWRSTPRDQQRLVSLIDWWTAKKDYCLSDALKLAHVGFRKLLTRDGWMYRRDSMSGRPLFSSIQILHPLHNRRTIGYFGSKVIFDIFARKMRISQWGGIAQW